MAIYNIFEKEEEFEEEALHINESSQSSGEKHAQEKKPFILKDHLFSTIAARLFFFFLMILDILWGVFSFVRLLLLTALSMLAGFRSQILRKIISKAYLDLKRSLVCAIALFVAVFCPALGVMFACSYFLMYDKEGIDEIVPSVLRSQFKEFFAY